MSTTDHPVSIFPAWFDRFQNKYMNPAIRPLAPYLPGFAVLEHHGRKSGRPFATPVNAFRSGDKFYVALGHGRTDWVKNILAAGEADTRSAFRRYHLVNPRVVDRESAGPGLPLAARVAGRRLELFVADIEPAH
ncbi:nitroreductase family deazaflavin-dependent oxidoreductase [Nocardia sp. NPDC020380]|uniref:nitroreductase family deazaflavin-dependent oxidoreductase n=1 Tax=Nocardia sp. NPDC020380 TaxID=3364309 RepID=UPI00378F8D06